MKKAEAKQLRVGDRVRLAKPFRFGKEQDNESEPGVDTLIKAGTGCGVVTSDLDSDNTLLVRWDNPTGALQDPELWVHYECLEEETPPATEEEVEDAIRSILGG